MIREGDMLRDRWRIDKLIGRGTMATVWAATHRNGDRVAIKVLNPELVHDNGTVKQRFLREAYVANAISHPGVVRVIDDDALPDGSPFLVMDLLVGDTLEAHRRRKGGKLDADETVKILDQLLDTLDAAHRKNIVHRDLKPDNLFRETDGRIRILDFGLARLLEGNDLATQAGALLGTPEFMAPEQAAGKTSDVDARTDLWAVGATAFLLFSGENVYDAHNVPALLNAILSKPPRRLGPLAPNVSSDIVKVIEGALVRDKSQRWQSAADMRDALKVARGSSREDLERAETVSTDSQNLPEPVTHKMARAGEEDAATTLREAAAPSTPTMVSEGGLAIEPATVTVVTPRPLPAARPIAPIVSETEAMLHAPVRRPPPAIDLTPVPTPLPRPLAETRVQPITGPEPMRAALPPAPPAPLAKSMSVFILLAIAGLFAILVMAIVISLK